MVSEQSWLSQSRQWLFSIAFMGVIQLTMAWFTLVAKAVPEPYLDEFFHVPQAQKYCKGDYSWDPKITTPPGLYLMSMLLSPILGCDTSSLRFLNTVASWLIIPLCTSIFQSLRDRNYKPSQKPNATKSEEIPTPTKDRILTHDAHVALNIALFPPLIFFSALYYTDLLSTLLVLVSYRIYLNKTSTFGTFWWNAQTIFIGITALFFRQTNIFWVAVFPAGLTLIDVLKQHGEPSKQTSVIKASTTLQQSWSTGTVCDFNLQDAEIQDYAIFLVSLVVAALKKPTLVLRVVVPYVVLLVLFASFVIWNGSVVLGDKTAHTATIHVPQMLYIWPYITFFSLPILIGPLLAPISALLPSHIRTFYGDSLTGSAKWHIPNLLIPTIFLAAGLLAVHYNTIIHPYTLADNRHYVFYVFRIIRRHWAVKYLAVPVYCTSAWLTMRALHTPGSYKSTSEHPPKVNSVVKSTDHRPCQISFVIVWAATTALSVITAPLVEPRYFIIPWIMWRLHVPNTMWEVNTGSSSKKPTYDMRLFVETIWLLAIDGMLGYVFLYRTFTWPNEPGKLQRFIW